MLQAFIVGLMVGAFAGWSITFAWRRRSTDDDGDDGFWDVPDYPPPDLMYGTAQPSRVPAPVKVDKPPPPPPR